MAIPLKRWLIAALVASTAPASAAEPEIMARPSAEDYAAAQERAESFLELARFGDAEVTISSILTGPPNRAIDDGIENAIETLEKLLSDHGPIRTCELVERSHFGTMMIRMTYVCQQNTALMEWNIETRRLPSGWNIRNVNFKTATLKDY